MQLQQLLGWPFCWIPLSWFSERERERERRYPARKPQLAGVVAGTLVALSTRKKSATWKLVSTKAVCFLCRVFLQLAAEFLLCMYPHLNNYLLSKLDLFSCYYFVVEDWRFLEEEEYYHYYIVGGSLQLF